MQIISILLVIISLVTLLSGIAILGGAHKGSRLQAFFYFVITFCSLLWTISVVVFLDLSEGASPDLLHLLAIGIYVPALYLIWAVFAFATYKTTAGKIGMLFYGVAAVALTYFFVTRPDLHYSAITLSPVDGNVIHLNHNWLNLSFVIYFILTSTTYIIGLLRTTLKTKDARLRRAYFIILIGFASTGVFALVFNVIWSYFGKYDTIWIGPLAMMISSLVYYYAIVRYRTLDVAGNWLKNLTYIIVVSVAAMVYLMIFLIVFTALFKVPNPSTEIIILAFVMALIVFAIMPAINEFSAFFSSLSSSNSVNVSYIVKKLSLLIGTEVSTAELAAFLADHLHFEYFGILTRDGLYDTADLKIPPADLELIAHSHATADSMLVEPSDELARAMKRLGIVAVAELKNARGRSTGHVLFGKPTGNISFADRDFGPVEIVLSIVPILIQPGNRRIKRHLL